MPSEIFKLAKIFESMLSKLMPEEIKDLKNKLNSPDDQVQDEEIIIIFENLKKLADTKSSTILSKWSENSWKLKAFSFICEDFLDQARLLLTEFNKLKYKDEKKKNEIANKYESWLYKIPADSLFYILTFLNKADVASAANASFKISQLIKKIIAHYFFQLLVLTVILIKN